MYYPEANVLVPKDVDPLSKTPGFKSVAVTVEAEDVLPIAAQAAAAAGHRAQRQPSLSDPLRTAASAGQPPR